MRCGKSITKRKRKNNDRKNMPKVQSANEWREMY